MSDDPIHNQLSQAHMRAVDRDYWDPEERATGVHQIIWKAIEEDREKNPKDSPTNWDVACWALAYLSQTAVGLGSEPLIQALRWTNGIIWSIHYSNFKELYGAPDKRGKTGGRYKSDKGRRDARGSSQDQEGEPRNPVHNGTGVPLSPKPNDPVYPEGAD